MQKALVIEFRLSEINDAAKKLWEFAKNYSVWTFEGEMGAGKTTLIKAVCQQLGVQDAVSSPTYAIVNEYETILSGKVITIYHSDWYRLDDEEEARDAGIEELLYVADSYHFVEWSSKAPGLLNRPYATITLEQKDENSRILSLNFSN